MLAPWTPNPALYLSPEMVAELALGQDDPLTIAQKYGMTVAEFEALNAQPWFGDAVYRKREQLQAEGVTFVAKAQMMAEEMWQDIYQLSKSGDGMRMEHRIEAAKQLTDIAGLKPKAAAASANGPSFTINISIPDNPQGPQLKAVGGHSEADKPPAMVIEMKPADDFPKPPPGLKIPDFKLTPDLVGNPLAGGPPTQPFASPVADRAQSVAAIARIMGPP
jgi:hypothetical protein